MKISKVTAAVILLIGIIVGATSRASRQPDDLTEIAFENRSAEGISSIELEYGNTHLKVRRLTGGTFETAMVRAGGEPDYRIQITVKFEDGTVLHAKQVAIPGEKRTLLIFKDRVSSTTRKADAW